MGTSVQNCLLARWESEALLFEPDQLRRRIEVLDQLEVYFPDPVDPACSFAAEDQPARERVRALRRQLESANAAVYEQVRSQVRSAARPFSLLLRWLEAFRAGHPAPGLGYDPLDEFLHGVLQPQEPGMAAAPGPERVFYQPTPARHILRLVEVSGLSDNDVLIDLGSGLGHVSMLASILSGCRSIGIELEAAYVSSAERSARSLCLERVRFLQQDVVQADLSAGTVFYLYTPFVGGLLGTVLRKLRAEGANRAITVCTLGPCTSAVAIEPWLKPMAAVDSAQINCFRSAASLAKAGVPRVPDRDR